MLQIAEEARNLIAKNCFEEATQVLLNNEICRKFHNKLRMLSAQLSEIREEKIMDTTSPDELRRNRNKVGRSLLMIADELDKDDAPVFYLSKDMLQIISLAETQARRDDREKTSTRYVLSALVNMPPDQIKDILAIMQEKKAIKDVISLEVKELPHHYTPGRNLSHCVRTSLTELNKVASEDNPITPADFFIDVSTHGVGKSVRRMRSKGFDETAIQNFVNDFKLKVKHRQPQLN